MNGDKHTSQAPNWNENAFIILVGVFTASITIGSVLSSKIVDIFGFFVPAGVFAYSFTFICTDVINEIWGKERALQTVLAGFVALIVVLVIVRTTLWWPKAPAWEHQEAFRTIIDRSSRVIVGSFLAYLVSQYHDVWAFNFWKRVTKGRYLWLRNNLSTTVSQFLHSVIFITIAFYGEMAKWPPIYGQWNIRFIFALIDTPLVYLIVWFLRRKPGQSKSVAT